MSGREWKSILVHHGDPRRDLVLLAARRHGGLKLREIGEKVGLDYGTVANALYRIRGKIAAERGVAKV